MGETIRVICRIRPLNKIEIGKNSKVCVSFPNSTTIAIGGKNYNFDSVLNSCTQQVAYEVIGMPIVDSVINGYNGTIFVYGQTSSGKTHTMEGDLKDPENMGIIPRILEEIFLRIGKMTGNLEFLLKVSYMELYMEKIKDLFDSDKDNLPVNEDKNHIPFVKGLTERFVSSYEDVIDALDEGKLNRHVSFTMMNATSSRSHSLFCIMINQRNMDTGQALEGRLNLVDLAGSEKVSKTGAEGSTLDEAKMINKSLSTLGNVINALVEGSNHIPYRDSKLTRILQQSLGGNAKTTMVICASPAEYNEAETKSTILFGVRAKSIKNDVKCNVQLSAEQWQKLYEKEQESSKKFQGIVQALEGELKKWRGGEKVAKPDWFTPDKYGTVVVAADTSTPPAALAEMIVPPPPPNKDKADFSEPKSVKKKEPRPSAEKLDPAEVQALYKELDEKDAQIDQLTQKGYKIQKKFDELKKSTTKQKEESASADQQTGSMSKELELKNKELKDVVNALEDLAMKYDQKSTTLDARVKELEDLNKELAELKKKSKKSGSDKDAKKAVTELKKALLDSMKDITKLLYEHAVLIAPTISKSPIKLAENVEEQSAYLLFLLAQLKAASGPGGEIDKLLKGISPGDDAPDGKSAASEPEATDVKGMRKEVDRKIKEMKLRVGESEKSIARVTEEKAKLQADLNAVNKEFMALKQSQVLIKEVEAIKNKDPDLLDRVVAASDRSANHYQEQIGRMRTEQENAAKSMERFREQNIMLKLQLDTIMLDLETLRKRVEADGKPDPVAPLKEQAKNDIKPLESSILQDLQTLHNLRKMFIQDLRARIKKNAARQPIDFITDQDEDDDGSEGTVQQREKIAALSAAVDTLTSANKELVRDNGDLNCELPRLQKRLNATADRINELEDTLKAIKEKAVMEKQKYKIETERLKESAFGGAKKGTNIARPIRVGK